jgi:hypothetical protein
VVRRRVSAESTQAQTAENVQPNLCHRYAESQHVAYETEGSVSIVPQVAYQVLMAMEAA